MLVLFAVFYSITVHAQIIYVENGFSKSRMYSKIPALTKYITNYSLSAGVEYFIHRNYELSSEIGYLVKGGKEINLLPELENNPEKMNFLQLNTTFRGKLAKNNEVLYVGIGPKLDFSLDKNSSLHGFYSEYKTNSIVYGLITEIGTKTQFNGKYTIGLSATYFIDFNPIAFTKYNNMRNSTFLFSLSAGYAL